MHQGSGEKNTEARKLEPQQVSETLKVKPTPPWATTEHWRCPEQRKVIVTDWNWPEVESMVVAGSRAAEAAIHKPLELTSQRHLPHMLDMDL